MPVHHAYLSSVVFCAEPVRSTKYVHHYLVFMTEITDGRQATVAAVMDDEEGRENGERQAAEEPDETEICEVDDLKTLPVLFFVFCFCYILTSI